MLRSIISFGLIIASCGAVAQPITASELLQKTIGYHDPQGQWSTFEQQLFFETDMPDGSQRTSQVKIDNTTGSFEYTNPDRSFGIEMDSCYHISGEEQACDRRLSSVYVSNND